MRTLFKSGVDVAFPKSKAASNFTGNMDYRQQLQPKPHFPGVVHLATQDRDKNKTLQGQIDSTFRSGKQILPPHFSILLISLLLLLITFPLFAETLALQSFENQPSDTWSYTANPTPDSKRIWWGPTTEAMGGATAYNGSYYWAGWDLDNVESTVTFSTLTLQAGFTYNVSFYYFTKNLATTNDYCRYSVKYDNGSNWDNWVTVNNNSNAWTAVSVEVPSGSNYLRLRLSSKFDGSTKYAHWDYIKVEKTPIPNSAPVVSNVTASQRTDGSKIVDIWYDLADADGDTCTVTALLSNDNGASFTITPNPANLSGAVGEGILPGSGKHIAWNAGAESVGFDGSDFRIKIEADDNANPPVPENFIFVPGGTFIMGDTRGGGEEWELPTHSVTLLSFYIGKFEVTQAEYLMYLQPEWGWSSEYGFGDSYPTYNVSWYDILKYCNLRSLAEGLTPVYSISGTTDPAAWGVVPIEWNLTWDAAVCNWSASGYRLPTEAEWEYAARGATNNPDFLYSGSDDINAVAWYQGNNIPWGSKPVGTKAANGLGIYDMSGNILEWCWDRYGSYGSSPCSNPTGPASGSYRVVRGGFWGITGYWSRVAYRSYSDPYYRFSRYVGFRVLRAIP